jgi:hypothetical protein
MDKPKKIIGIAFMLSNQKIMFIRNYRIILTTNNFVKDLCRADSKVMLNTLRFNKRGWRVADCAKAAHDKTSVAILLPVSCAVDC